MEKKKAVVSLRLEGPLQSWGERSKWDRRDTADFPSKSGVIGLVACAMGLERNDDRINHIAENTQYAVRRDRTGTLITDFHTVTGEPMINAEGKPRNANTIITPRQYLQDACFTAFICGEKELIEEMAEALQNPKWVFFLGRKSCVPSCPVFNGIVYDKTAEQALLDQESFPVRLRKNEPATARILYETPSVDNPTYSRSDEIVDMGKREFRRRDITLKYMEVKNVSE